jgi:LmbE family N-acetylglucosaminyl deacetylase/SAM-dependent methyltransferase
LRTTEEPASTRVPFRHDDVGTPASAWDDLVVAARRIHFADLPTEGRTVVVAPHPDDESLGAGGLVSGLAAAGATVDVVVCSDGAAAEVVMADGVDLRTLRRDEVASAVRALTGGRSTVTLLDLPDGQLAHRHDELVERLRPLLAGADLVVGPWPEDGHPDHLGTGMATRAAAPDHAVVLEYPVWFWHWGRPGDPPQGEWVALALAAATRRAKSTAISQHRSQTGGAHPLLSTTFLEHFARPEELYLVHRGRPHPADRSGAVFFDAMYRAAADGDPWSFRTDPAEQARFDRLASLAAARPVRRCLEPGCSTGELTRRLARCCDRVVALDVARAAVDAARVHLGALAEVDGGVDLRVGRVPDDLGPDDTDLDLLVLSEVAYYVGPDELTAWVRALHGRCASDARWLLCHWTGTSVDHRLSGGEAHAVLGAELSALGWDCSSSEQVGEHLVAVWERAGAGSAT